MTVWFVLKLEDDAKRVKASGSVSATSVIPFCLDVLMEASQARVRTSTRAIAVER
jgi:hypothetical protein